MFAAGSWQVRKYRPQGMDVFRRIYMQVARNMMNGLAAYIAPVQMIIDLELLV